MTQKRPSGPQFGFDARGLPRLEERTAGQYRPVLNNTQQTRLLKADELGLAETQPNRVLQNMNYADASQEAKTLKARSRLDYMRALSEAIKKNRQLSGGEKKQPNGLVRLLRKVQGR